MYSIYNQAYKGTTGYPINSFSLDEKDFVSGGLYLRYYLVPRIALETSPFISKLTNDRTTYISFANPQPGAPGSVSSYESRYELSYIQLPVTAEYHFARIFHFGIGPQFGFLRKAKLEDTDIAYTIHSNITSFVTDVGIEARQGLEAGFSNTHSFNTVSLDIPGSSFQLEKFNFWNIYLKIRIYSSHADKSSASDKSDNRTKD